MPDMVCVKCNRKMRIEKNGVQAIEFTPIHKTTGEFLHLEPYQMHDSDKWKCPECGVEILAGFGQKPWAVEGMTWIETPAPGDRIKICFADMLRRVIHSPHQTYVKYTDFGKEEQKAIQWLMAKRGVGVEVILNTKENENVSGTDTPDSGDGSPGEGRDDN